MVLNPLDQIHLVTMAATFVIFLLTLLVLRRVAFLPLIDVMERRSARIEAARAQKAEGESLLRNAQLQADEAVAAAKAEAARILGSARDEIAAIRRAKMAQATTEAEAILARGREEVLALRASEETQLAKQLFASVGKALTTMIGPVEDSAVRLMVNRVMAAKEAG